MTTLSGFARNFLQLLLARVGMGIGESGCLPASQSIVCDYVPIARRPMMFSLHSVGLTVGTMAGMALAGLLGDRIGWRNTFIAMGLPGTFLALVLYLTLREPTRGKFDVVVPDNDTPALLATITTLLRSRSWVLLTLYLITHLFVHFGLSQWWPSFYGRVHHMPLAAAGVQLGLANGVGSAMGLLVGGFVSAGAARCGGSQPLYACAGIFVLAAPLAIASLFVPDTTLSIWLSALTVFCLLVPHGTVMANFYSVVGSRMRATGGALTIFLQSVIGLGFGPVCVGMVSDHFAPSLGNLSLRYALLVPALIIPVAAAILVGAARALVADLGYAVDARGATGENA